jgi:hypothetical protein
MRIAGAASGLRMAAKTVLRAVPKQETPMTQSTGHQIFVCTDSRRFRIELGYCFAFFEGGDAQNANHSRARNVSRGK